MTLIRTVCLAVVLAATAALVGAQTLEPITLRGTVLDSISAEPIAYASLRLLHARDDSVTAGALTDEKGAFTLEGIPPGRYHLELDFIGYRKKLIGPIALSSQEPQHSLGRIGLAPTFYQLNDVQITDRQDLMLNNIDRKTYNVEKNLIAEGGAATDILKTIPSVEVDIDGNLSLRGSGNVTVLIDGKPSALTGAGRSAILQQIPASSIKSIEVITNPSARYDPDGMSGIINIITKKNKAAGLNGNLSLGAGTNEKYNASLSLGYRSKRFNAHGNYSFRMEDRWATGISNSTTLGDSVSPVLLNDTKGSRVSTDHLVRTGIDIYLGERTTLGLGGGWAGQGRKSVDLNTVSEQTIAAVPVSQYDRLTHETEWMGNYDGELNFQHKFKKLRRVLDARIAYSQGSSQEDNFFRTLHLLENGTPTSLPDDYQNNYQTDRIALGTAQVDYAHQRNEKQQWELGGKLTSRDIRNSFASETLDHGSETFLKDTLLGNDFQYQERILAAYGIFSHTISEKLAAQVGLRAEQALTQSLLVNTQDVFTNNYFKLFPNAYLSYTPQRGREWRLSYSRRINRPTTDQLNPFTDYSNPKRLRTGNPELLPELIDALEFSFNRRFTWGSLSSTGYFRYISDSHTRYFTPLNPGSDTVNMTFVNLVSGQNYGLEFIALAKPAQWMDLMLSGNFYRTVMNARNLETDLTVDNIGMSSNLNATFYFSKNTNLQVTANYSSPRRGPQGTIAAMFSTDVAIKQNVLKGRGSINLRLSDVFNTRRFKIIAQTSEVTGHHYRKRESRIGYVTFSYRFGTGDAQPKRKRNTEERSSGGDFDF